MIENDDWETLTAHDLDSRDSATAARIQALLRTALGRCGQNRESREQNRAISLLRSFTINRICKICAHCLKEPIDSPEVAGHANQIFDSLAWGAPFRSANRYKTWLASWDPTRGSFAGFVTLTASSRCRELSSWRKTDACAHERRGYPPEDEDGHIADMDYYADTSADAPDSAYAWLRYEKLLITAIEQLSSTYRAAMYALLQGDTAADYAIQHGIEATTAQNHFSRGQRQLVALLVDQGIIDEDFGNQSARTPQDLVKSLKSRLPDEMTNSQLQSTMNKGVRL